MIGTILLSILIACISIQVFYWFVIFSRLIFFKEKNINKPTELPRVSVVVCAYNEAPYLKSYLPKILEQDYPNFELLLVDDASTDNTQTILEELKKEYSHLNTLHLSYPKGKATIGKKNALSNGINHARHDVVLVTDADCFPSSDQWIKHMVLGMKGGGSIAFGYGPYKKEKGFLNSFIRYETVYTAIQYMSFSLWGIPYMGVGRNMIYDKNLFHKVGGFDKHSHIASGDDDLFVNEIANEKNTSIVINNKSHMISPAKDTWKGYFSQKSRHMTTGRHYKLLHQVLLGLLSLSHFGSYFFAFISIIYGISIIFVIMMLLGLVILKTLIFASIAYKLNERSLIPIIPLLDIIYILYYILLAPALFWGKTAKWK